MKRTLMAGVVGLLALTAACGDDDDAASDDTTVADETTSDATDVATDETDGTEVADETTSTSADDTTGITGEGGDTTVTGDTDGPQRIVSLAPTHTETMFAIGAGDLLIAVDEYSYYPEEALDLPSDLSGFEPNVEAISEYDPDLVVLSRDEGIVEQLDTLGIDTWVGDSAQSIDHAYEQIEQLGEITGHEDEAGELVEEMRSDIDELTSDLPDGVEGLSVYHEVSDVYHSAGSESFAGQIYELFGLENIAGDELFPQLNAEQIVSEDPDLIFLTHAGGSGTTVEDVAARDGWQDMIAVQNEAIFVLDDDVAARWGPRIVDQVRDVREALDAVAGGPGE